MGCPQGAIKFVQDIIVDHQKAAKAIGVVVTTAGNLVGIPVGKLKIYSEKMIEFWNEKAGNGSLKLGERSLPMNETLDGNIVGTFGRLFVTPEVMQHDSAKLTVWEKDGKGKVEVDICKHDKDGKSTHLEYFCFNDDKDQKNNKSEQHSVVLKNIRNHVITCNFDGGSVANSMKYSIRLSPED